MLTVEEARQLVRRTGSKFDGELEALIGAATKDLTNVGIKSLTDDPLYDQALRMYVRGHFDPGAPDSQACCEIYKEIKETLKLSTAYREGDV